VLLTHAFPELDDPVKVNPLSIDVVYRLSIQSLLIKKGGDNNHMEVLAPAGTFEALKAAIAAGADAVYIGGKRFSARRMADNFSNAELKAAINFAHDHDVRVYVTVNTLIKDQELKEAISYLDMLESLEADAVIIQDRGLLKIARERFTIPIHASTQMGIHSLEGALWAEENGISRIILARELSLEEIQRIREGSRIELEVFVHGALCYSVSGQCLFSSLAGGRSGNRGLCAQPCRIWYSLGEMEGYLLSTADLFAIDSIPRLLELDIESIKIEGRMRSPIYVYLATKIYKNAIERARKNEPLIRERERELLEVVFNRGFTGGYLVSGNVTQRAYPDSRGKYLGVFETKEGKLVLDGSKVASGDGITLYKENLKVGGMEIVDYTRDGMMIVIRVPFRLDDGYYEVYKTKDREFNRISKLLESINAEYDMKPPVLRQPDLRFPKHERKPGSPDISCYLTSVEALEAVLPYTDRVYFDMGNDLEIARQICMDHGLEFVPILPRISPEVPFVDGDRLMISTLGQYQRYRERKLFGHYSLNFFNSFTTPDLFQYTLSVELSRNEIKDICSHYPGRVEVLAFGRIELMVTRDPTLPEGILTDKGGRKFRVYRDIYGYAHILNCADILLLDHLDELTSIGVDSIGLDLRRRSPSLCKLVAKAFKEGDTGMKSAIKRRCGKITRGRFIKGVR